MNFDLLDKNSVRISADKNVESDVDRVVYLNYREGDTLFVSQEEVEAWKSILPIPNRAEFDISYYLDDEIIQISFCWEGDN